jgi:TctA family transporter
VERKELASGAPERQNINYRQVITGLGDVLRARWLLVRCAAISSIVGVVPGLGGDAASWMCYGHAVQTSKRPEEFGKGRVEGVIGAETGSCAKEGGALLPTIFFGVPGSSGMAILLGAFLMLGLQPGPTMMLEHGDVVWAMIWTIALSNLVCVLILLASAPWITSLAYIKTSLMVPIVLVFAILGCYVGQNAWENLVLIFFLGIISYLLKRHDWPRAPFVIGVILGKIAEDSLLKAIAISGYVFFTGPISIFLILCIIASIAFWFYKIRSGKTLEVAHG